MLCVFVCFQSPYVCDTAAGSESCNSAEQRLTVERDGQKLNSCQNLFSNLQASCIDGTLLSDTKHPLLLKFEHKHTADSAADVDTCDQEQIDIAFKSSDNVQSIVVNLPLIARLRHTKCETPVPCIKTENVDADEDRCAVDKEDIEAPTAADVNETDETQADVKKETTAAAKGLQLARETIANILGTELQPPTTIKIPIKRRAERDANERSDTKQSRTFSRNDDVHDGRSSDRQDSWYVLDGLHFDHNTVHRILQLT